MSVGMGFSFAPRPGPAVDVSAQSAREAARQARSQVQEMGFEIERLLMITEALWMLLREKHGYTDADLIKRIAEIDLRDGRLDGRVAKDGKALRDCLQCGRPTGRKRPTCLYCGAAVVRDPFAR